MKKLFGEVERKKKFFNISIVKLKSRGINSLKPLQTRKEKCKKKIV